MYDIAIIGAGAVGAAIARHLSRYRLTICLLEKEAEASFGVSKSNSGIIHPGTQNPAHSLKGRLCVEGNRLIRRIARELGIDFKEVGELIVALSETEAGQLDQLLRDARALGVPGVRIVDQSWLRAHEPQLNPAARAALYAPSAGIISPYRLVYDLIENAERNGVELRTLARVNAITAGRTGFVIETSGGQVLSRSVINCAGLCADDICRMVGISDVRISPLKGEEFILDKKREYLTNHLIFPLPTKVSKGILVIKTADGNPMIGPTAVPVQDKEDLATSAEGLAQVLAGARRLVPAISDRDIIAYFAGLRPSAGEDFIIRAEKEVAGFITVAGIQSPGLTCAVSIALLVERLLRQQGVILRKKLFFRCRRRPSVHLFSLKVPCAARLIARDPAYGDMVCRCEMVSAREIRQAVRQGAVTLDGIKFRTRAQAGRCHGSFCTSRVMKILAEETKIRVSSVTKRGPGSEVVVKDRKP